MDHLCFILSLYISATLNVKQVWIELYVFTGAGMFVEWYVQYVISMIDHVSVTIWYTRKATLIYQCHHYVIKTALTMPECLVSKCKIRCDQEKSVLYRRNCTLVYCVGHIRYNDNYILATVGDRSTVVLRGKCTFARLPCLAIIISPPPKKKKSPSKKTHSSPADKTLYMAWHNMCQASLFCWFSGGIKVNLSAIFLERFVMYRYWCLPDEYHHLASIVIMIFLHPNRRMPFLQRFVHRVIQSTAPGNSWNRRFSFNQWCFTHCSVPPITQIPLFMETISYLFNMLFELYHFFCKK